MTITSENIFAKDTFEVVEKIPAGFFVWNIGKNMMHDDYIPLCEDLHPEDKDDYSINRNTLKAIKLDVVDTMKLRDAASVGIVDLQTAQKAIKSKRRGYWSDRKREAAKMTIGIYERITK